MASGLSVTKIRKNVIGGALFITLYCTSRDKFNDNC